MRVLKVFLMGLVCFATLAFWSILKAETKSVTLTVKNGKGIGSVTFSEPSKENPDYEMNVQTPNKNWYFIKPSSSDISWKVKDVSEHEVNAKKTVYNVTSSAEFFGVAAKGKMKTKGPKPGSPIPWEATAEGFFIHSVDPVEYIKVVFPWVGTRKFVVAKDEKVPAPDWKLTKSGVDDIDLGSGNSITITKADFEKGPNGEEPKIKEPGEYTLTATSGSISDSMIVIILKVDLDVDSNNDGSIDANDKGEDEYEEYAPGVIVCKDRDGDNIPDHLVKLKIRPLPDYIKDGTLTLGIPQGFANITVWKDASQMERVGLPKTYDVASDAIPETLYIDGNKAGKAILDLTYKTTEGVEAGKDKVAIYVTPTIAWSPSINHAQFWEPCEWADFVKGSLPSYPADTIFNCIKDEGWRIMAKRYKPLAFFPVTGSAFGDLTLSNFKGMNFSGFVCVFTHGQPGFIAGIFAYDRQSIVDWIGTESNMEPRFDGHLWYARVYSDWLLFNWSSKLTQMKAITVFASCSGAAGVDVDPEISSNIAKAGGRVQFGYNATINTLVAKNDMEKLLNRMNGTTDNAEKRVAKDAYDAGGFDDHFKMYGNGYTTLCPSPITTFPSANPGGRNGWGCIIFDTYMMNWFPANQAVRKIKGSCSVSNFRWISNGAEDFCVGFDFDNKNGGGATMHAAADKCQAAGIGYLRLDGNGVSPSKDKKDWSF